MDFYPSPDSNVVVGHPALQSRAGEEAVFRIPLESGGEGLNSLPGLIVYGQQDDGSDRAGLTISETARTATASSAMQALPDRRSLAAYLFFGFLGGLILNLMPCVLPVISLKIFGFVQHAGQSRKGIFQSGLFFAAGIFAWFVGLRSRPDRPAARRTPDHVGASIHEPVFRSRDELRCARLRVESVGRF